MKRIAIFLIISLLAVLSTQGQTDSVPFKKFYHTWIYQKKTNLNYPKMRPGVSPNAGIKNKYGALFEVKDSSLLMTDITEKFDLAAGDFKLSEVYSSQIQMIMLQKSGSRGLGTLIGGAVGLTAGLIFALANDSKWNKSTGVNELEPFDNSMRAFGFIAITVGFTGAGLGIGAIIDAVSKIKININGKQNKFEAARTKMAPCSLKEIYGGKIKPVKPFKVLSDTIPN